MSFLLSISVYICGLIWCISFDHEVCWIWIVLIVFNIIYFGLVVLRGVSVSQLRYVCVNSFFNISVVFGISCIGCTIHVIVILSSGCVSWLGYCHSACFFSCRFASVFYTANSGVAVCGVRFHCLVCDVSIVFALNASATAVKFLSGLVLADEVDISPLSSMISPSFISSFFALFFFVSVHRFLFAMFKVNNCEC